MYFFCKFENIYINLIALELTLDSKLFEYARKINK